MWHYNYRGQRNNCDAISLDQYLYLYKGKYMHKFGEYLFDSNRLLFYNENISKEDLDIVYNQIDSNDHNSKVLNELVRQNEHKTPLEKIAVNSMGICLTFNCNLRCNYCGYSSTDRDNNRLQPSDIDAFVKDIIKKKVIKNLITKQNDPLMVYFTGGGEPTYDWELLTYAVNCVKENCHANNIQFRMSITTNGILTDDQIDFISNSFTRVMISYDGLPQIQNSNRIGPNIADTNLIVEHSIDEISKRGIPLEVRTTIWQEDYDKLFEMYRHVFSIPSNKDNVSWSIYPTLVEGRALRRIQRQKDFTYKKFVSYYFDLIDYVIANEGEERLSAINCPLFGNNPVSLFCGSLFGDEPFLQPDGSIILCNESKDHSICIGEVKNGKLEYYNQFKNDFLEVTLKKYTECTNCIAYRFCRGGCPIWHLRQEDNKCEPLECQATQEYWKHIIETVAIKKYYYGWCLDKMHIPNISGEVFRLVKKESVNNET